jgi:glutaredoxin-like YruB-family protein
MTKHLACLFALFLIISVTAGYATEISSPNQSTINPSEPKTLTYPGIVLYSTAWCPHCKNAKEYFTKNNIPFINRDVELDETAMETLLHTYKSRTVPVIVIGNDAIILKGFNKPDFEKAIEAYKKQPKP